MTEKQMPVCVLGQLLPASYMAMSGASPSEMAQVLGHRSLSMVARYAHLHDDHARSTLEKMAEKIMKEDKKGES